MTFSIRLTPEEKELAKSYSKLHSISMAEAFKRAFFEKLEDEFDLKVVEEVMQEYEQNGKKSRPISELWKELSL